MARFRFRSPPAACCRSTRKGGMGGKRGRECDRQFQSQRRHLYVALDDWEEGFSLYKIDVESDQEQLRLPEPAAQRLVGDPYIVPFAAVGSKILITTTMAVDAAGAEAEAEAEPSMMFIYDTEAAALSMGPRLPAKLLQGLYMAVPVGGKLYVLASHRTQHHSLKVLSPAPARSRDLSWGAVPSPPPFRCDENVCSYALHPDGCTIFITTTTESSSGKKKKKKKKKKRTYSFDTEHCSWTRHRGWALPFQDQGYFCTKLDAWVGLHRNGYICSSKVGPTASCSANPPTQQVEVRGKQKLFRKDLTPHLSATLTPMGTNKFCLAESVICGMEGARCVLHLTVFSLKCNKKKEPLAIIHHTHSYPATLHSDQYPMSAFWM